MSKISKQQAHVFRFIGLAIGALLLIYTIKSFGGYQTLLDNLMRVQAFYLVLILNSFLWMLCYTEAWYLLIRDIKKKWKFFALLKIKLCGEGINFMTPLGFFAGDPVRVLLLRKSLGPGGRLSSVVLDRMIHSLAAQCYCLLGALLIFTQDIDFPIWLHALLLVLYTSISITFFILIVSLIMGRGFVFFDRVLERLTIKRRFPGVDAKMQDLRLSLKEYQSEPNAIFVMSFFSHFVGRLFTACEIMIILYCYQGEWRPIFALILSVLTSFFSIIMGWIPGALGALEYLYAQFFMVYGFSSEVGVSVQIVRRLRVFLWMFVGILLLDYAEIGNFFNKFRRPESGVNDEQKN